MDDVDDITMYWLHAQRANAQLYGSFVEHRLPTWQSAATAAGMRLEVVTPDDVMVAGAADGARVWVAGKQVDPVSCLFHTNLIPSPESERDTWRFLSLAGVLEAAGFHTTVPASVNIGTNDKLLAVMKYGAPGVEWLPTLRVSTRDMCKLPDCDLGLSYPLIVKPANWGGGHGILRANTPDELQPILQLAGAGEVTMVVQPWLGYGVVDYRIYCIDGRAYRAASRVPTGTSLTGNACQGGKAAILDVPVGLREPAESIACALDLSYVCVDFLHADGKYWLSEVEVDGGMPADEDLMNARFASYRGQFDRFRRSSAASEDVALGVSSSA